MTMMPGADETKRSQATASLEQNMKLVEPSAKPIALRTVVWRRYKSHVPALIGSGVMLLLIIVAIFAPQVTGGRDPYISDLKDFRASPSKIHPLGTDAIGRDVFSRLIYASRVSLSVGLVAVTISLVIGTMLGLSAGYLGGAVDSVIMRLADIVLCFPSLMLILIIVSLLGPSIYNVMAVMGLLGWPGVCRLVRGNILTLREQEFVLAARAVGVRDYQIAFRHILPNTMAEIIVAGTVGLAGAILMEAGLSFLGLGVQPPTASWGNMLLDAQSLTILESMPWLWVPPGLMIVLSVLSINFIGDGLRDASDPRSLGRAR